jgi:hypothetical protein
MRAILIDPFNRSIGEIEVTGDSLDGMYRIMGCQTVERVRIDRRNDLWLDEDANLRPEAEQAYFWWRGYPTRLGGRCLIFGSTEEGESVGTDMDVEYVTSMVAWIETTIARLFRPQLPKFYSIGDDGSLQEIK